MVYIIKYAWESFLQELERTLNNWKISDDCLQIMTELMQNALVIWVSVDG